jgi:23S rRNA pseudouridine1911/1915/1917 synthase
VSAAVQARRRLPLPDLRDSPLDFNHDDLIGCLVCWMSSRTENFVIDRSYPNSRLDTFLRVRFPMASRGAIQRLIDEGHILVNGHKVKPTHTPRAGEQIQVHWPDPRPAVAQPEDISLEVLYEDEGLIVLNKPPGLVVHPAAGHEDHTLVNALLHHCSGKLSGIGGVARPGIVHRLDKETSGCLVAAKNDDFHVALSAQFAGRKVEKIYHAVVCGTLPREKGEIRAAISRHSLHRKRMAVNEDTGRAAHTTYKVVERLRASTHVEVSLHTGRTHQIRVHFQFIGYPLVGDQTYGQRQNVKLGDITSYVAPRQMLHAVQLSFTHPSTGQRMSFKAPLPADFEDALAALREPAR